MSMSANIASNLNHFAHKKRFMIWFANALDGELPLRRAMLLHKNFIRGD